MATEKFNRSVAVGADRAAIWSALTDVDRLAGWIGIVHDVKELSRLDRYTAVLEARVGPFKLSADLSIDVTVPEDGVRVELSAAGSDRAVDSRISLSATLELVAADNGTSIVVNGVYQVTGRVASMGGGIIRKKADGVLNDFFSNAERELA